MSRRRRTVPSYRLHKVSGQAVVTLSGQDIYLGRHGTLASHNEYDRVTSEWLASGRASASHVRQDAVSVAELVNAFRKSDAIPDSHMDAYKAVIKLLVRLYGQTTAEAFGPLALKVVRDKMVEAGWKRHTVNQRTHNLRRIFRWGAENELVPAEIVQSLATVEGLREGKTNAPESEQVQPVAVEDVQETINYASPTIRAMVQLQQYTGARAGEICCMRTCDIETSEQIWVYRPGHHKTKHRGKTREITLGPKAQAVLKPFLLTDLNAFIFSPARAEEARRKLLTDGRKTPLSYGNRVGTNKRPKPRKTLGNAYDTSTYRRAIQDACDRAFPAPPPLGRHENETLSRWRARLTPEQRIELLTWRRKHRWHPHQLRHAFANQVRRDFGLEHAQKVLGHAHANVTERYAQVDLSKSKEVAAAIG